jgi:hypothetical protein
VTPLNIEVEAEKTLTALRMWWLPVDPMAIAREEGIELAPGRYGETFDARIKFVRAAKTFILSYRQACLGLTEGRVRFSIGHELGHYYLAHHREYLLLGHTHRSVTDFRSREPREIEADEFSSALLMPAPLFAAAMKSRNMTICTLADLSRLAESTFQTSLTSTVLRYVGFDWEACSMVVSRDGVVKWAQHSRRMKALRMGWIECGTPVPNNTPTAELWSRLTKEATLERIEGRVDADMWFDRPFRTHLWEETMPLGFTGLVLTFLTVDED